MHFAARIALEIFASIIIGIISSFFIKEPFIDLFIGVATFLTLEILKIGLLVDKIKQSVTTLAEVANSLQRPFHNTIDSFFNTLILSQLKRNYFNAMPHRIKIPASDAQSFWLRTLSYVDESYFGISYTKLSEGWERGYTTKAMTLHREKIAQGVQFNRLFIVDDDEELKKIKKTMNAQKDMGIIVRYLKIDAMKNLRITSKNIRLFGTYVYAILDHTYVLKFFLDRKRRWTELELTNDEEIIALAKNIYQDLWEESTEL